MVRLGQTKFWSYLQVERKIDVVACLALGFSIVHIAFNIIMSFRGPHVELFPPSQIVIEHEKAANDRSYVRFAAIMAYANNTQSGYGAVIKRERLEYIIDGRSFTQQWQKFIRSDSKRIQGEEKLEIIDVDIASPFVVSSKNAISHETYFSPGTENCKSQDEHCDKYRNFLEADEFMDLIALENNETENIIRFNLVAEILNEEDEVASCNVIIDENLLYWLNKKGWVAPRCWPIENEDA